MNTKKHNPRKTKNLDLDIYIGKMIRYFRSAKGITQRVLAEKLKITFQQIQKYENGTSAVSSSVLKKISEILGTEMSRFFPQDNDGKLKVSENSTEDQFSVNQPHDRRLMSIIKYFYSVKDESKRDLILTFIKSVAIEDNKK